MSNQFLCIYLESLKLFICIKKSLDRRENQSVRKLIWRLHFCTLLEKSFHCLIIMFSSSYITLPVIIYSDRQIQEIEPRDINRQHLSTCSAVSCKLLDNNL